MEKLGIIGCSGFIGSHLVEKLLGCGRYAVTGIDLVSGKIEHLLGNPGLSFIRCDVDTLPSFDTVLGDCDIIISLAALCNPSLYNTVALDVIESNFLRPYGLVRWCAERKKRLIHFSTSEVYGKTVQGIAGSSLVNREHSSHYLLSEDATPLIMGPVNAQRWSYATAKQLMERVIYACGVESGLDYTIVRPFNFIGSRMDFIPGIDGEGTPRVLACFMEALLLGKPLRLVDGGLSRRVFTDIEDAVDAVLRIIVRPEKARQRIFNIGNPENETTIRGLASAMIDLYTSLYPHQHCKPEMTAVSAWEFYGPGYEDCDRRVPDISHAQKLLGWRPRIKLRDSLARTILSYVEYYTKEHAA